MAGLLTLPLGLLSGGARPRVDSHAPYEATFGPEAVELYATTGRTLDPWQVDSLDVMMAYRPGGKWVHFEHGEIVSRQNGKGVVGEARVMSGLWLLDEKLIMWSAHRYKTAMEAFRRLQILIEANDELSRRIRKISTTNGDESIELYGAGRNKLTGAQRLCFLARSAQTGRGLTGDCNIIDEAFALTFDQLGALLFTVSAVANPQCVYLSSPPLESDQGEVLFALRKRGEAGGDPALAWRDWGVAGDLSDLGAIDLDDRGLWKQSNPGRIGEEQIERERRALAARPHVFARERLGVWPPPPSEAAQWRVIPYRLWKAKEDPQSVPKGRIALGVKVLPDRSFASVGAAGYRTGGGRMVDVFERRPGVRWVLEALRDLDAEYDPIVIVVDDRAVADEAEQAGLVVHRASVPDVVAAAGMLYDGVAGDDEIGRDVHHPGREELDEAVAWATRRTVGGAWAWGSANLSVDSTPLGGVSLGLWGLATQRVHRLARAPEPEIFV